MIVLFTAACLFQPIAGETAETTKKRYSTNAVDQADCRRQLNLIHGAIQEYYERHKQLPRWLSDLTPDFLSDPDGLVCPFVRKTGNLEAWRKGFVNFGVHNDPNGGSYAYEFCLELFRYIPGWTMRHFKQRQMEVIGFGVPIVRCFAHRPVLNLGFDGSVYPNLTGRVEWEDNFATTPKHTIALHDVLTLSKSSQNEAALQVIEPRGPEADARMLDLSGHYNASFLHLSHVDSQGKLLLAYPDESEIIAGIGFDLRGLVHLTGRNFPIAFPQAIQNIEVDRRCAAIHFLHGTMSKAPEGAVIGHYIVHYEKEGESTQIPIIYGKDVRTRWFDPEQPAALENPPVAWFTPPDRVTSTGKAVRLYKQTWTNPQPGSTVRRIDFQSQMTASAPFLVAITAE
jgi:hypothetical protein